VLVQSVEVRVDQSRVRLEGKKVEKERTVE
jgi:hypothetical protein